MIVVILSNVLCMFMVHYGQGPKWDVAMSASNIVFTGIFVIEMILKWISISITPYFQDGWNIFDFIVVVVSVLGVILDYAQISSLTFLPLLRVLRVLRIFKLIPKAKGLRTMLMTLLWSLPALGNVGAVLFMFMFIYAIIGMNLFGNIKFADQITRLANFRDFPTAMITLFRIITGENWTQLMSDCMVKSNCIYVKETYTVMALNTTVMRGTYLDGADNSTLISFLPDNIMQNQCSPAPILAIMFFCSYMLVVAYLMLQLIIGIILENIEVHASIETMSIKQSHIQLFVETWEELDVHGTGYIDAPSLTALLLAIPSPMGVKGQDHVAMRIQEIVQSVNIPFRNNRIHFLETLHALAGRVAGAALPADEEYMIHNKMIQRLPKEEVPLKYSVGDYYAALYVKTSIKGFLARAKLKPLFDAYLAQEKEQDALLKANPNAAIMLKARAMATLSRRQRDEILSTVTSIKGTSGHQDGVGKGSDTCQQHQEGSLQQQQQEPDSPDSSVPAPHSRR